ncbi:MAG: protein-L-isoaspartate(D-aspartate) O-methyltransferase [Methanospirillum sp.]|nr:protein-L-isoaspartate(D-aspartate) O-methyltransferase [Methanospirillum sp.]
MNSNRAEEREYMVKTQIQARGVRNESVLHAMNKVPRHLFVPEESAREAYQDYPLSIGNGQTISQPYIVALMTELLDPQSGDLILEIGSGSGYQAAILAACKARVITIERIREVAARAEQNLKQAGVTGVTVLTGDGTTGYPENAPYDRVLITAATPRIPPPLVDQLAEGGYLVAPEGDRDIQQLVRLKKNRDEISIERFGTVRFVPLLGRYGWNKDEEN